MSEANRRLVYIIGNSVPGQDLATLFDSVNSTVRELEQSFFEDGSQASVGDENNPHNPTDAITSTTGDGWYDKVFELADAISELSAKETVLLSMACGVRLAELATGVRPERKAADGSPVGGYMSYTSQLEYPAQASAELQEASRDRVKLYTLVRDGTTIASVENKTEMPIIAVEFVKNGQLELLSHNAGQHKA